MRIAGRTCSWFVVAGIVAVVVLACAVLGPLGQYSSSLLGALRSGDCAPGERAALAAAPPLADAPARRLEGACRVVYTTPRSPAEVEDYYARRLRSEGWQVNGAAAGEDGGEADGGGRSIVARRGGLRYSIRVLPVGGNAEGGVGAPARTEVVVAVSAVER